MKRNLLIRKLPAKQAFLDNNLRINDGQISFKQNKPTKAVLVCKNEKKLNNQRKIFYYTLAVALAAEKRVRLFLVSDLFIVFHC